MITTTPTQAFMHKLDDTINFMTIQLRDIFYDKETGEIRHHNLLNEKYNGQLTNLLESVQELRQLVNEDPHLFDQLLLNHDMHSLYTTDLSIILKQMNLEVETYMSDKNICPFLKEHVDFLEKTHIVLENISAIAGEHPSEDYDLYSHRLDLYQKFIEDAARDIDFKYSDHFEYIYNTCDHSCHSGYIYMEESEGNLIVNYY